MRGVDWWAPLPPEFLRGPLCFFAGDRVVVDVGIIGKKGARACVYENIFLGETK